ncbi:hypothetical protein EVAR_11368_1 [Eumeta japonica]|uniref:Uncharacterized protein n=1 Tax=Eumeta variegata TaxID=151549 RepID=A0A4C1U173_EUMVA|nr:hypothetical protein EVAR_11368_1 [Eumeta japonica]
MIQLKSMQRVKVGFENKMMQLSAIEIEVYLHTCFACLDLEEDTPPLRFWDLHRDQHSPDRLIEYSLEPLLGKRRALEILHCAYLLRHGQSLRG